MDQLALRAYLLGKPGAVEDYPFGADALVPKVGGKMFALLALTADPPRISLKCDPIDAQFLRDQYPAVQPGYHMNKQHWNTVVVDGSIPEPELLRMIDESYRLVVKGLPRAMRPPVAE
jgi:predicted DNA-binding protein (MmcQ/YjbR family)